MTSSKPAPQAGEIKTRAVIVLVGLGVAAFFWITADRTGDVVNRGFSALAMVASVGALVWLGAGVRARSNERREDNLDALAQEMHTVAPLARTVRAELDAAGGAVRAGTRKRTEKSLAHFDEVLPRWRGLSDRPSGASITNLRSAATSLNSQLMSAQSRIANEIALSHHGDSND